MENIISYIAGAASLVAIIVSVYNSKIEKRRLIAEAITKNRIEWIKDVRSILMSYAESYKANSKKDMEILMSKLKLYLSHNEIYLKLVQEAEICLLDKEYSGKHNEEFLLCAEEVLSFAWVRMKREAGITKERDKKTLFNLKKEFHWLTCDIKNKE